MIIIEQIYFSDDIRYTKNNTNSVINLALFLHVAEALIMAVTNTVLN